MTKRAMVKELQELIKQHEEYAEQVEQLVKEGKAKSGALLVYGTYRTYPFRWLYGMDKDYQATRHCKLGGTWMKRTKSYEYRTQIEWMKEEIEEIKNFIAEHQ